ncbi:hypothetical protein EDD15DRAFT_2373174 [Pisolithus albus]|nr:hypothetical protein EDD15DRAFT_2373174 [Pisolithus albus]
MPLELVPPPSPRGKTPPPKHQCSTTVPCPLRLSEMGRQYHPFPKGTFKARFSPPALPKFVVSHFAKHPPVWTWSVKAGPNRGKAFQVPTTPIACDKTASKAVQWIVSVFHSFKTHLNPIAIDPDTGKVQPAWLRLYQNNLHIHIRNQLKARPPRRRGPPPTKPAPATTNPAPSGPKADGTNQHVTRLEAEVAALRAEVRSLNEKFFKYIASHEACCQRDDSSSSSSAEAATDRDDNPPAPEPPHPPFELLMQRPDGITVPDSNPPPWLTSVLSRIDLPPSFSGALFSPDSMIDYLPRNATDVLKLHFHNSPPFCLAVTADRSLWTVGSAYVDRSQITSIIKLPPDPSVPTAQS